MISALILSHHGLANDRLFAGNAGEMRGCKLQDNQLYAVNKARVKLGSEPSNTARLIADTARNLCR